MTLAATLLAVGVLAVAQAPLRLSSPVLKDGGTIPRRFTCDGAGTSPPLRWTAPPAHTARLQLTVVDPDAPGGHFVHWQATRIPPRAGSVAAGRHLPGEGTNSAGTRGWTPPCPPGGTHRYVFTLTALGKSGRVLATAKLVVRYGR